MFLESLNEFNLDFDFDDNFNDALIEGAVEMEAAYYDFVTESCQIKFQEISESASVEALNEGVIDAIKNFFKKIWNAIRDLQGKVGKLEGSVGNMYSAVEKILTNLKNSGAWKQTGDTVFEGKFNDGRSIATGNINIFGGTPDGNSYIRTNNGSSENDLAGGV